MTKRSLVKMVILMLVTIGIYLIYWLVATKKDLNKISPKIPTAWLFIVPIANIYFLYKFAESFCEYILKDKSQTIGYFLLLVLLLPAGEVILQSKINEQIVTV